MCHVPANAITDAFCVLNRPVDLTDALDQLNFLWDSPKLHGYEVLRRYVHEGGRIDECDWLTFKNTALESYYSLDCFPFDDYGDSLGLICLLFIMRDLFTCGDDNVPLLSQTSCSIPKERGRTHIANIAIGVLEHFKINKDAFFKLMPINMH